MQLAFAWWGKRPESLPSDRKGETNRNWGGGGIPGKSEVMGGCKVRLQGAALEESQARSIELKDRANVSGGPAVQPDGKLGRSSGFQAARTVVSRASTVGAGAY